MRTLSLLTVLSLVPFCQAALPPGSYDTLRIKAEEAIIIQVTSVRVTPAGGHKDVTVNAKVVGLERTKNGLKRGDAITIKYMITDTPIPGPEPIPVIEKDIIYPACLNKSGTDYAPAAFGWSFRMTPEM